MSIQFVAGKLKGEERKAIIQRVQKQMQEAALGAIKPLVTEFCEEELTVKLGRGKREPRRVGGQARQIDWQCGNCGCRDANHFTRDGHYQRALETGWGHVEGLRVPMLECQCCGRDVICPYTILEKYGRFWLDTEQADWERRNHPRRTKARRRRRMSFDINEAVFDSGGTYLEEKAVRYEHALMEQFAASPKGQAITQTGTELG